MIPLSQHCCLLFALSSLPFRRPRRLALRTACAAPCPCSYQILSTLLLGIFTMFTFAFLIFTYWPDHVPDHNCNELSACMQVTIGFGLRSSGGIGDYLDREGGGYEALGSRYILDLLFFLLVIIILMNIIFGIIIDQFSELRESRKEREMQTTDFCFVCGLEKNAFEGQGQAAGGDGFEHHIKHEHNLWGYLKFIIHLELQSLDDDDGLEQYTRRCLQQKDIGWFPEGRCLGLEGGGGGGLAAHDA